MSNGTNGHTEEDLREGHDQVCCLVDDSLRCTRPAGNASYSKRIQKTVQQRRLKLTIDHSVRHIYICDAHKNMIQNLRSKRKRKDSEVEGDYSEFDFDTPEIDFFQMPVNTLRRYKRHYKLQTRPGLNKAQLADVRHIYICDAHKNMIQNLRSKRKRKDSEVEGDYSEFDFDTPEIDFFQMPVNTLRRYKRHYKLQTRPGLNKAQLADTVARHFKTIPVVEKEALTFFIYMAKNYKSRFDTKHLETLTS